MIRKVPRERGEGQGIGGVPLETFEEGPPLKPVQKMALILELAAMFVATLIGAVLFPRSETAWLHTSVPLVPLVWYAIGRWLNGLLGYSAPASALEHRHLFVLGLADACTVNAPFTAISADDLPIIMSMVPGSMTQCGEKRVGPGNFLRVPGGWKHWSGGDAKEGALFYEESSGKFDTILAK